MPYIHDAYTSPLKKPARLSIQIPTRQGVNKAITDLRRINLISCPERRIVMCLLRHRICRQNLRAKGLLCGHNLNNIYGGAADASTLYSTRHVPGGDPTDAFGGVCKFRLVALTIDRDVPYWDKGERRRCWGTWFSE